MGYLIFKGVSTAELPSVAVSQMPSHKRGAMRYTEYYVKGRDGALHVDEGLANIELQTKLVLLDGDPAARTAVNAWAMGTGKLISSDDLTKAYKASVKREIQWNRVPGNQGFFDTATINFDCDPYMYEASETEEEFTEDGTITNPGTAVAFPLIELEGEGDASFTIDRYQVTILGMEENVPVFVDCENGYVYTSTGTMEMVGEFPELQIGANIVALGSNMTKITITPHWRWV